MNATVKLVGTGLIPLMIDGKNHYVDKHTGEIVLEETLKKLPEHRVDKYVGIDRKWLKDCVTEDDYKATIGTIDGWSYQPVRVDDKLINELIFSKSITVNQAAILSELCQRVLAWNITLTTTSELSESTGINPKSVARALKDMCPTFIKIVKRDVPDRGNITIEVNPKLAWRGGYHFNEDKSRQWMKHLTDHLRGQ